MKENIYLTFQIATVFIGTIVGAGLASGQEIKQFFTSYGYKSFIGIIICCLVYIFISLIIIKLSIKYNLSSYNEVINLVSPGYLGKATNWITSIFLLCSSAIILAGSGALIHQYLGLSKWVGIFFMSLFSLLVLLKNTKGLIEINSFIVPSLMIIIITLFTLYILFNKDISNFSYIKSIPYEKNPWLLSSLLYSGFNILCCTGVLAPLSSEIKKERPLIIGVILGSISLTIIGSMINFMLLLNTPYIYKYEIPLLYIANRFGTIIQLMLFCIIWLEMFSTEVSNIYSISKSLEQKFNISYKKSIFLILIIAIPISQVGFVNLISVLYPAFGFLSIIFMIQCCIFYYKDKII